MTFHIKICGLSTPETLDAALNAGATMIGLNFHPKSPRFIATAPATALAAHAQDRAEVAVLVVDQPVAAVRALTARVKPGWVQLHGQETADEIRAVRAATGCRILKAIGVSTRGDLATLPALAAAADLILIDAKPPKDAAYPGGHGRPFDWTILRALDPSMPFLLSGGLTPDNVGDAIGQVRGYGLDLAGIDVSSGVETAPGIKDAAKIRAFVAAARAAG